MCSWESDNYKLERDTARKKLNLAENELAAYKNLFQGFVGMVNKSCEDESLSLDDFIFYWRNAIESGEEVFADQFVTLMMTAKIFFGEELHKIRIDEERTAEGYRKAALKSREKRAQNTKEYEQLLEIRGNERVLSIKKRKKLLDKIFASHSTLDDLSDEDIPHARALIESGNLKPTYWLGRLKILKREDIPPENDDGYYGCKDHPGCPYSGGSDFYNLMARMVSS